MIYVRDLKIAFFFHEEIAEMRFVKAYASVLYV